MPRVTTASTTNPIIRAINAVLNADTGKMEKYRHLIKGPQVHKWQVTNAKEIARLAQGQADGSVIGKSRKNTFDLYFINSCQYALYSRYTYDIVIYI